MDQALLTEKQTADFLHLSPRTLQRWRIEPPPTGAPKFIRIGRRVLYDRAAVLDWARSHSYQTTAEADETQAGCPA